MKRYKYFRMKIDLFPQDIINKCNCLTMWMPTETCSVRYAVECTDSPKQE